MQLPFNIDKAIDGLARVTLRGGVVGKGTFAVVLVSVCIAAIAMSVSNLWLSFAAIAAIFILAFAMLWRLINFADRNPQAALLEGAEFLVHQQIIHATKITGAIPLPQLEKEVAEQIDSTDPELATAQLPDQDPKTLQAPKENP